MVNAKDDCAAFLFEDKPDPQDSQSGKGQDDGAGEDGEGEEEAGEEGIEDRGIEIRGLESWMTGGV
jgi:hypothetical protein